MASIPAPDAEQLAASRALTKQMRDSLDRAGGWFSFADYMRLALYTPGLGYYSGGARKFGAAGDFVTAPELSPLFGQTLAAPVAAVLAAVGGDVLEVGAGSGRLAADLLLALGQAGQLPDHYYILELSAELAARQRASLAQSVPQYIERISWLTSLPEAFTGCIVGNEVLDAMPCRLVVYREGAWHERGVVWQDGWAWADRGIDDTHDVAHLPVRGLPDGYLTEIQPEACAFVASLADVTLAGALLLPDYGFAAAEYYHPQRDRGTLMCHYRHHSHDNPFHLPGLEDITTHIDFSAIWRAGSASGWQLEGYTSQSSFLIDAGIIAHLSCHSPGEPSYFQHAAAVQKLLGPAEMGELFKVIGFSKGLPPMPVLPGFRRDDRSGFL
jgi:SAM-dependent MidA family methyltransferase